MIATVESVIELQSYFMKMPMQWNTTGYNIVASQELILAALAAQLWVQKNNAMQNVSIPGEEEEKLSQLNAVCIGNHLWLQWISVSRELLLIGGKCGARPYLGSTSP